MALKRENEKGERVERRGEQRAGKKKVKRK